MTIANDFLIRSNSVILKVFLQFFFISEHCTIKPETFFPVMQYGAGNPCLHMFLWGSCINNNHIWIFLFCFDQLFVCSYCSNWLGLEFDRILINKSWGTPANW